MEGIAASAGVLSVVWAILAMWFIVVLVLRPFRVGQIRDEARKQTALLEAINRRLARLEPAPYLQREPENPALQSGTP